MRKIFLRATLLAGTSFLVACAGDDETETNAAKEISAVEEKSAAMAKDAAAKDPAAKDSDALVIPDAPPNPLASINAKKSEEYLAANAAREGVRTLESGLQIETLKEGQEQTPSESDFLRFHYTGKLIDGTVFDDSTVLDDPLVIPSYTAIPIPGMPEAFAEMKEGETAQVTVPPALAFGEEGIPGVFEPNQTLIFDLQLIEVITDDEGERREEIIAEQERLLEAQRREQEASQKEAMAAFEKQAAENLSASETFLAETAKEEGVTTTSSGLQFEVLEDGGSGETPDPWDTVEVHYHGTLPDGTVFDSSYDRGKTISFPLSGVIKGWTEGVGLMNVGDKYKFYIPSALGYGASGTPGGPIGPNQALVFEVELLGIEQGEEPTPPADTASPAQ
ncbi:MAG: FKBP-type peptidyl-prolyl cis-trans isomerase [Pseudomonadota bacterium]